MKTFDLKKALAGERGITYNEYLQLKQKDNEVLRSNSESNQD